jgi:hypothetical protein
VFFIEAVITSASIKLKTPGTWDDVLLLTGDDVLLLTGDDVLLLTGDDVLLLTWDDVSSVKVGLVLFLEDLDLLCGLLAFLCGLLDFLCGLLLRGR